MIAIHNFVIRNTGPTDAHQVIRRMRTAALAHADLQAVRRIAACECAELGTFRRVCCVQ